MSSQNSIQASKQSSMSGSIHRANNVDYSKFQFGEIQLNRYGGKSSRVSYNNSEFYIQTPRMRLPYGLGAYVEKDKNGNPVSGKEPKYSFDFSFAGYEEGEDGNPADPKVKEFFDFLNELQTLLVKNAQANSFSWLNLPKATEDVARALVRDTVRYAKDKVTKMPTNKYPPTFKAKVGYWENKFTVKAFDENRNTIEDLKTFAVPRTEAVAILKLTGVNFAGGKCGFGWQVVQVKLYPPSSMPSYAFIDDEESERPVQSSSRDKELEDDEDEGNNKANNRVEDSDDDKDDLDEEDEEEEEVPQPPPKKTTLVKKTVKTVKK
jgi:hypothetical protein